MKVNNLCLFLVVIALVFGSCSKNADPKPFSAFSEHKFNDILTSLDYGRGDTLILGTSNGKIIFYNTIDASSSQDSVGNDRVYFVRQDTLPNSKAVTFVGVRNEGLKWFDGNHFDKPHMLKFGKKGYHYSVYRVERDSDWLICATSNGIAILNLNKLDSLQPIFPDTVADDYKISSLQRIDSVLYASHDKFIHKVELGNGQPRCNKKTDTCKNIINNLYADTKGELMIVQKDFLICDGGIKHKNRLDVHSYLRNPASENKYMLMSDDRFLLGNSLNQDSLPVFQLTLANEQYTPTANIAVKTGYTYFISGTSLCQIPNHLPREQHFTAIAKNKMLAISDQNGVYSKENETRFQRQFVARRDSIKNEISQAYLIQDKLCVLSGGHVYFHVDGRHDCSLTGLCDTFNRNKITRIYVNSKDYIFFAFREGYAYGKTRDGVLDSSSLVIVPNLLSVQCFNQPNDNDSILYVGTLNDGCVKRNIYTGQNLDTLFRELTNIIDIVLSDDKKFILTPMVLYTAKKGDTLTRNSLNIRNLNICRIYPLTYKHKNCLLGVSTKGGLYMFTREKPTVIDTLYPDILFYPDAIDIQGNIITAGTSIGLIKIDLNENGENQLCEIQLHEPLLVQLKYFIRNHLQKFIRIGLPSALALVLIIIILSIWIFFKTKKINELNKNNNDLKKNNKSLNGQFKKLSIENKKLEKANTKLNALKNDYENDLKRFESSREVMRKEVLANKLFWEDRNIGTFRMTSIINKNKEYHDFLNEKEDLIKKINEVDKHRSDYFREMQRYADSVHNKLWEPSLRLDALALREWCLQHHQELMDKEKPYVSIFRKQIDSISDTISETIRFSSRRDEETCSIYLKMWASALLLFEPTPLEQEDPQNLSKSYLKSQKNKRSDIIKLLKPQNLYPLLFEEKNLSRDNFYRKKTNLFNDLKEMESYKGKAYETMPVFECDNKFVKSALERLRDMTKDSAKDAGGK